MKPSEVRDLIGRQHIQLRIFFVEVENTCREALECDRTDPKLMVLKLVRTVAEHIKLEDRILLPALRQLDGWGAVRADHAAAEHARQREQLIALRILARSGSRDEAARTALDLIRELMVDMDGEERDLLGPDLLRDDPVVINQSDG